MAVVLTTPPASTILPSAQETQRENLHNGLESMYAVPSCLGIPYTFSSMTVTVAPTTCIQPGMRVTGASIPAGTYVVSGSGTNYTLSVAPTMNRTASFNGPFASASGIADFALDPHMQTAAYPNAFGTAGSTLIACLPDGTHYSASCQQEISSRGACARNRALGSWLHAGSTWDEFRSQP